MNVLALYVAKGSLFRFQRNGDIDTAVHICAVTDANLNTQKKIDMEERLRLMNSGSFLFLLTGRFNLLVVF